MRPLAVLHPSRGWCDDRCVAKWTKQQLATARSMRFLDNLHQAAGECGQVLDMPTTEDIAQFDREERARAHAAVDPDNLTEEQVAIKLGVKIKTLRAWRTPKQEKGPPAAKIGRQVVYPKTSLDAWIEAKTQKESQPSRPASPSGKLALASKVSRKRLVRRHAFGGHTTKRDRGHSDTSKQA